MKTLLESIFTFFENRSPAFPEHPVQTPPANLLAFCVFYSQGMRMPLVMMSITTALIAMLEVSLFGFLGNLVDWLSTQNPSTFFSDHGGALLGMTFVLLVCLPVLIFLHAAIVHQTLLGNFPMAIRWSVHRYLLHQSLSFYQDEFAGRIATKMMQTALSVREFTMKVLDIFVYVGVYFCSMIVLAVQQDWRLALPLGLWLIGYISLQYWLLPPLRRVSEQQADARADMTGKIVDSYTNITTVKLFSHTASELNYAKNSMTRFLSTVYRQMRLVTGLSVGINVLNYLLVFFIGLISIFLWRFELITLGAIAIVISMSFRLNGMAQWILWEVSHVFEHIGTVIDGMNTLSKPLTVQDQLAAKPVSIDQGEIQFKDVYFSYTPSQPLFENLNLTIRGGEKVGIVGRSGAGKSTLVNLILRFYDLQSGSICIDGQNIAQIQQESLRSAIAVVTQDNSLLHRSIHENITYGRPDASVSEVQEAARHAKAYEFIQELKDMKGRSGFNAQVGERGVKLSGGQRQRIAIARVLLKDAPILILDEATSALDSEVEQAIQSSLTHLMRNKTVIAIAHRLSTIAALDRLIVFDQGQIVEQGTHHQLLDKGGIYARLWAHQSGGFLGQN